jgi:hypothetical protein
MSPLSQDSADLDLGGATLNHPIRMMTRVIDR